MLISVAVLLLNDHVLKSRYGNWWTGKLSDVAGLLVLPILLVAGIEVVRSMLGSNGWVASARDVDVVLVIVGIGFTATKLLSPAADLYGTLLGTIRWLPKTVLHGTNYARVEVTLDPSDLLALPVLVVARVLARQHIRRLKTLDVPAAAASAAV